MDTHIKFDRKLVTKDLIHAILFVMRGKQVLAKRPSWARLDTRESFLAVTGSSSWQLQ
jgi:hypothetical protein